MKYNQSWWNNLDDSERYILFGLAKGLLALMLNGPIIQRPVKERNKK